MPKTKKKTKKAEPNYMGMIGVTKKRHREVVDKVIARLRMLSGFTEGVNEYGWPRVINVHGHYVEGRNKQTGRKVREWFVHEISFAAMEPGGMRGGGSSIMRSDPHGFITCAAVENLLLTLSEKPRDFPEQESFECTEAGDMLDDIWKMGDNKEESPPPEKPAEQVVCNDPKHETPCPPTALSPLVANIPVRKGDKIDYKAHGGETATATVEVVKKKDGLPVYILDNGSWCRKPDITKVY